jgi:uncharacterized protein
MNTMINEKTKINSINSEYVHQLVKQAAQFISPVWPIDTFIACNPLHGFEEQHFNTALHQSYHMYHQDQIPPGLEAVNVASIKWLSAFLDLGQGSIEMPNRELGFYRNFCALAIFDQKLHQGIDKNKHFIETLPKDAASAVLYCLHTLKIDKKDHQDFLIQNFAYLPGWAGYVKWYSMWKDSQQLRHNPSINLTEYIAVRLILTCLLWSEIDLEKKKQFSSPVVDNQINIIQKNEKAYQDILLSKLMPTSKVVDTVHQPDMQMVFCIDVRSEPFRRKLEQKGAYETFGFAGFFGLAVRIHDTTHQHKKDCCPALLKPQYDIQTDFNATSKEIEHFSNRKDFLDSFVSAYQQLKYNVVTPFNLADAMGPWCGIAMFVRNFFPGFFEKTLQKIKHQIQTPIETKLSAAPHGVFGIPQKDQVVIALSALRLMGLVENFAKFVIFCGHKSTTTNNPYASALDCGACGGNHGDQNARLLADILNQPFIREELKNHGIDIPNDTVFLGGVHDTTNDECEIFTNDTISHPDLLEQIRAHLREVQQENMQSRAQYFSQPNQLGLERTHNWSELRPEWGLAKNASFIVAPRSKTAHIDLDARSFLHSYDWTIDQEGTLLETILTAPMVVAQWINTQYLFSTLDNTIYGSGNKITHNVTGKLGIMQGNGSDLMHGLALQSVNTKQDKAFHVPQRLLTIVYAPRELIMSIINRQQVLQKLFYNEWVHLICFCPNTSCFYKLNPDKTWGKLSDFGA